MAGMNEILEGWQNDGIEWVRFELPDMHGTSRSKTVPMRHAFGYAERGLNMYGGTSVLDSRSDVVGGTLYNEARGPVQGVEAPPGVLHPVPPDPDAAEGRGHPALLQALTGPSGGPGCLTVESPQGLPIQLSRSPLALCRHPLLEGHRVDLLIHRHPQFDHYHLGHEALLPVARSG